MDDTEVEVSAGLRLSGVVWWPLPDDAVLVTVGDSVSIEWRFGERPKPMPPVLDGEVLAGFANLWGPGEGVEGFTLRERVEQFAARYGPLGLCAAHERPIRHIPARVVREGLRGERGHLSADDSVGVVESRPDPKVDSLDGPWEHVFACDQASGWDPERSRGQASGDSPGGSRRREPLEAWLRWSQVAYAILFAARELSSPDGYVEYEVMAPLDEVLPLPVDQLVRFTDRWDSSEKRPSRWDEGPNKAMKKRTGLPTPSEVQGVAEEYRRDHPEVGVDDIQWLALPTESLKAEQQVLRNEQRRALASAVDGWLGLADVRFTLRWDEGPPESEEEQGTGGPRIEQEDVGEPVLVMDTGGLFGALGVLLSQVVGRVDRLSICHDCREAYVPSRVTRGKGVAIYCTKCNQNVARTRRAARKRKRRAGHPDTRAD